MKKTIFAAVMALCLMAGTSVFAQDSNMAQPAKQQWTPEQVAQKKADMMKQKLNLNDQQTKQVYDYSLERAKQMKMHRDQMHADRKAEMEKMKSILTPEQYKQYEQWKQMEGSGKMMHKDGKGKDCKGGKCGDKGKMKK